MLSLPSSLLLSLWVLLWGSSLGKELRIRNAAELANFSHDVNSGMPFKGTTIYLDADIDFSGVAFEPIGKDSETPFEGTFDGQGYAVRNLVIDTDSRYTGLIGNSNGGTIRNVVVDYSCFFTNSHTSADETAYVHIGGIVGACSVYQVGCAIKNCVSMANFTFDGSIKESKLFFGGIIGFVETADKAVSLVTNCANYGFATYSGESSIINVGGIVGRAKGSGSFKVKIYNCQNYGFTRHTGKITKYTDVGGIVGLAEDTLVENCLNTKGTNSNYTNDYTGNIVGCPTYVDIKQCYWTSESKIAVVHGKKNGRTNVNDSFIISCNETDVARLNEYSDEHGYNRWVLNENKDRVTFYVNGKKSFHTASGTIILQDLVESDGTGRVFSGWFTDSAFTVPFAGDDIGEHAALYSGWNYTVSINGAGGLISQVAMNVTCGRAYGRLPVALWEGNEFLYWYTLAAGEMAEVYSATVVTLPSEHVLYAAWVLNTVTFDLGNGTVLEAVVRHDEDIPYPADLAREGYDFLGWDAAPKKTRGRDVTVTALWNATGRSGDRGVEKPETDILGFVSVLIPVVLIVIVVGLAAILIVVYRRSKKVPSSRGGSELEEVLIKSKKGRKDKKGKKDGDRDADEDGDGEACNYNYDRTELARLVTPSLEEAEDEIAAGRALNTLYKVYRPGYARPTMKAALLKAGLAEEDADEIVEACTSAAEFAKADGKLFEGFTEEDAAALAMYTYDFGPRRFESNPYRIINKSLVGRNFSSLQKASGLLYLMMTALRKLPRVTGISLYRGVRDDVSMDEDHYREGNVVSWSALSSSSPDMKAIKAFLAKGPKRKKVTGTLFIIDNGWGYDIQPYSLFPGEAEILIEPDRQFQVTSVIQTESINIINLEMLDTPLALPQVFGEGQPKDQPEQPEQ